MRLRYRGLSLLLQLFADQRDVDTEVHILLMEEEELVEAIAHIAKEDGEEAKAQALAAVFMMARADANMRPLFEFAGLVVAAISTAETSDGEVREKALLVLQSLSFAAESVGIFKHSKLMETVVRIADTDEGVALVMQHSDDGPVGSEAVRDVVHAAEDGHAAHSLRT